MLAQAQALSIDNWVSYPAGPFRTELEHPDGWQATLTLASSGQFVAELSHQASGALNYDSLTIDQAHAYQYAGLCDDAQARFEGWISAHGPAALAELPVTVRLPRRLADAIKNRLPGLQRAESDLLMREAFAALKIELDRMG